MSETITRRLERGLPRTDMYSPAFREHVARGKIAAATERAEEIVSDARKEAGEIIAAARVEASGIVASAMAEAANVAAKKRAEGMPAADEGKKRPARSIMRQVAIRHGISVGDLVGASRALPIVQARHEAVALVRLYRPDLSTPQIGKLFGGRDHTTILNSIRRAGLADGRCGP